jgi:hypothetical protein
MTYKRSFQMQRYDKIAVLSAVLKQETWNLSHVYLRINSHQSRR